MEDINKIDAKMKLKLNHCPHALRLYIFLPNTGSIKQMTTQLIKPFVINTKIVICMHRTQIKRTLSMLATK